ncbi:MAG: aminotransferase class I/II-fold pyridoxal phosphate-dependent enzyme [Actinomycetota bacterium]
MWGAELERLRSLTGSKWTQDPPDVIPAWVADMDFESPQCVRSAIQALVDRGDFGYNFHARDQLVEAWRDWQHDAFGWKAPAEECEVVTATLSAMSMVVDMMSDPGDGIAFFTPIYHPFRMITADSGRREVGVPLDGPDYRLDPDRFEAALDPGTKILLFCNPHNPLGRMFDHDELAGMVDVALRHDLIVVSDEIWCDLTHQPGHIPLWEAFPEIRDRCITLGSASKSFSLAGLKTAVVHLGDPRVRARWEALPMAYVGGPSSLGAEATLAAWRHGREWLDGVVAQLTANRDHLLSRVDTDLPGVSMHSPEATYLAWLDFSQTPIAEDPAGALLERGRIGIHGGEKFCPSASAFARLNFATSPAILDELIDRIAHTLDTA